MVRVTAAQLLLLLLLPSVGDGGFGDGVLRAGTLAAEVEAEARARLAASAYDVDCVAMIVWSPCAIVHTHTAREGKGYQ